MRVKVTFPDGVRDVPARPLKHHSREIPSRADRIEWVPADDPEWSFSQRFGGWWAKRRADG